MNTEFFVSRRQTLTTLSGLTGLTGLPVLPLLAQDSASAPEVEPFNRFPRMLQEYYVQQLRNFERRNLARKAALNTKEDAEAYVKWVQEQIKRTFSPMPRQRTPLNAKITGTLDRDSYTVEKLVFESRPKFFVTANLYLPKGSQKKVPGVIGTCGHSNNGKAAEAYQSFAQSLARLGTACLIYDPLGQGERSQYLNEEHQLIYRGTTHEHNMAGNQMELVGEFLGAWRAWDGMRALDYLLSRPEIDSNHVGVTGNSGGGTMTTWLLGVEPRWTMGAPACFVTTWRRNLENELPQDNEQCPPRSLAFGLDHDDYLAAMAPKPVVILTKEQDYFDVRGSEETYERLRHLYGLLGAEENIKLHIGPTTHGYSQENREAMYRFFNSVTGVSDAKTEPDLIIEKDEDLWCTETGQVGTGLNSKTVFTFTAAKSKRLEKSRSSEPITEKELREKVTTSLHLPLRDSETPPRVRILRARGNRHYPKPYYNTYAVETEDGIQAVVTLLGMERMYSRPPSAQPGGSSRAVLWIANQSADEELRSDADLQKLIESEPEGTPIFACDVRGVGESLPGTTTDTNPHSYYGADYFYAAYANMLNRPYLGGKTHDVLRVLDFLGKYGWTDVHIAGRQLGCLPAGIAALFDSRVKTITLLDKLESWHSIATTEHYEWPLSHMVPGVLREWDLPDVWKTLAPRMT